MEFWALVQYLQRDIPRVTEREILEVVKGSDSRRFRVMAENRIWGPLQWEPVRIRAIQGHCEAVVKQCSMKSLVKDLFSLDPDIDLENFENKRHIARVNVEPQYSRCYREFPRVLYHTCDYGALKSIATYGLVPGGFPHKTGRSHCYFNPTPPWDADMKKFQGTRAGRPIALAFDTELLMQMGCKFFRTDEAVLSSDWATNMALIAAYDMRQGQFIWFNKAYEANRRAYQKMLKENVDVNPTLRTSRLMTIEKAAQVRFSTPGVYIQSGRILELSQAKTLEVEDSLATEKGATVKGYSVMFVMTPSTAEKCLNKRRGLRNKGQGKGKREERFDFEDMIYTELVQIPDINCPNQHCRTRLIDGYLQCPRCYQEIGANTDARVATEVARWEAMARVRGSPIFNGDH